MNHHPPFHRDLATWATAAAAVVCAASLAACGGGGPETALTASADSASSTASTSSASGTPTPAQGGAKAAAEPPALWSADGRSRTTPVAERPADSAAHWPGQRYATHAQLERELLVALPFTMVIDADDEDGLTRALELGEQLAVYGSEKSMLALFVRSRQHALAARLAERLTREQGWAHVWVVV